MLTNEAKWFGKKIAEISNKELGSIIELGSSSYFFRKFRQPWIDNYIFNPLSKRGLKVTHTDLELDVESHSFSKNIKKYGDFNSFFICNLLEHLNDYKIATKNIIATVPKNGYLFVSVPLVFPYHPNPIDNMYRPTISELKELFPGFKVVASKEVKEKRFITLNRSSIAWINRTFIASCVILKKIA